jgi:predicted lipase
MMASIIASHCLVVSTSVYEDDPTPSLRRAGLRLIAIFSKNSTQALIATDGDTIYLSYRGTDEFKDWVTDLKYVKIDFPGGGRVHSGFYAYYAEVRDQIQTALKTLPALPVIVTGHSLGGVSLMAGVEFNAVAGYFFGIPRIGNTDFVNRVDFPVYRFEHKTDPVPYTPPRQSPWQSIWALSHFRWPTLYAHAGDTIFVEGDLHRIKHYHKSVSGYLTKTLDMLK